MSIKIILADDHKVIREGIEALLEKQRDIEVLATAGDGRTAVRLARELSPDVVIMDVNMPELNGIEAARQIISENSKVRVIALSMYSDRQFVGEMLKAGASGYMLKDCDSGELVSTIHAVVKNEICLNPGIATEVIKENIYHAHGVNSSAFSVLTGRGREVLQLYAEGKSTKEIAARLCVSVKAIEKHRQQIMRKLDIHSIAELTKYAIREGLTTL